MPASAQKVLTVARNWLGRNESDGSHREIVDLYNSYRPLPRGYKLTYKDSWCDCFVSACGMRANATDIIGVECGCEEHVKLFKKMRIWHEDGMMRPEPGDIILFSWKKAVQPNNEYSNHIGFVEMVLGNSITTIEGNYKDAVGRRVINLGWGYIRGYARPRYTRHGPDEDINPTIPIDEVVEDVIRGAYGNGEERQKAIEALGYDYERVRKMVNERLKNPGITKPGYDTVAREVINGLWGNNPHREKALTEAGYDYSAVQKRVNDLLR